MEPKMLAADASSFLSVTVQSIHKKLRTLDLPFQKSQNRVFFGHETAKGIFNLSPTPQTIALQIVKGGTGKTSITHSLAIRAYLYGLRILCIDLDQQGNLTESLKFNPDQTPVMSDFISKPSINFEDCIVPIFPGFDLLPSRIENAVLDNLLMLHSLPLDRVYGDPLSKIKSQYDLILIDCPPALGQSVAAATLASDTVIIPVTPEKFSLSGLQVSCNEIKNIEERYRKQINTKILVNKFDGRTNLSTEVLKGLILHPVYGEKLCNTFVRINQEFPNVIDKGISIFDSLRTNSAKEDIDLLTIELLNLKEEQGSSPSDTDSRTSLEAELASLST